MWPPQRAGPGAWHGDTAGQDVPPTPPSGSRLRRACLHEDQDETVTWGLDGQTDGSGEAGGADLTAGPTQAPALCPTGAPRPGWLISSQAAPRPALAARPRLPARRPTGHPGSSPGLGCAPTRPCHPSWGRWAGRPTRREGTAAPHCLPPRLPRCARGSPRPRSPLSLGPGPWAAAGAPGPPGPTPPAVFQGQAGPLCRQAPAGAKALVAPQGQAAEETQADKRRHPHSAAVWDPHRTTSRSGRSEEGSDPVDLRKPTPGQDGE